jgi:hypothetical protein
MGYACPVCETPQADAGHLANHLAITAIARGGDHEAWLDEHVHDWEDMDEDGLAEAVVEHAADADYPQVFEDTTEGADATADGVDAEAMARLAETDLADADAEAIVERARELTRQRRADSETE